MAPIQANYGKSPLAWLDRASDSVARHWLALVSAFLGIFITLPWLSPLLMAAGWLAPAQLINHIYAAFCHQLPERSYFVFGYQVAYCTRNVALYSSLLVGGLVYARMRPRLRQHDAHEQVSYKGLSIPLAILLCLPILFDALSHSFGLRDAGAVLGWLGQSDLVGSTNWWLRQITAVLAGLALTFAIFPRVDTSFARSLAYSDYYRAQTRGLGGKSWQRQPSLPYSSPG
jgi:uncharacterized membrane protein